MKDKGKTDEEADSLFEQIEKEGIDCEAWEAWLSGKL